MRLIKREEIDKPEEVFNLHVKNNNNYVANNTVVSNCHAAKAEILENLLRQHFTHCPIRWGLTGTVPKEDFNLYSIVSAIGPVLEEKVSAKSLQDKGILSNCHVSIIQMQEVKSFKMYQEEMNFLLNDDDRLAYISKRVSQIAKTGNTLVLVQYVKSGKKLSEMTDGSVFIHGSTNSSDRKEEYDEIQTVNNKVLIATYGIAAVGINVPRIFNLVLIEPGKSFVRVIQSIGRGLRRAKDKDYVDIFDITSSCKYSKKHLSERKKFYKDAQYPYAITKVNYLGGSYD